jgi:hypothetical protein
MGMLVTGHHVWGRAYEHDNLQIDYEAPPTAIPISCNSTNEFIFLQTHITINPMNKTN